MSPPSSPPAPPSPPAPLAPKAPLSITLVRTSCLILEVAGQCLLTDPWFEDSMRGLPVFRRAAVPLAEVPAPTWILASHLHPDHFDLSAVEALQQPKTTLIGTRGTRDHCPRLILPIFELAPWERLQTGPLTVTATPCEHTGPPPAEVNFVIEIAGWTIFFGGDARWSPAFLAIHERFPRIDIALLPIGGTLIFGHRTTMNPADAVRACNALRPRWAVPIHEGGEWMPVPPASWHPGRFRHFVRELALSGLPVAPCVVQPGTTATWDGHAVTKARFSKRPQRR